MTGLVSIGGPLFAIGASGLAVNGNQVFGVLGGNDVALPPADAVAAARTARRRRDGEGAARPPAPRRDVGQVAWKQDLGKFNYQWTIDNKATIGAGDPDYQPGCAENPDFKPGDSNPYALTDAPGGDYMVDGGSNTLTWTPQNGPPRVVAAFPQPDPPAGPHNPVPYDAVPTCVPRWAARSSCPICTVASSSSSGSSQTVAPRPSPRRAGRSSSPPAAAPRTARGTSTSATSSPAAS